MDGGSDAPYRVHKDSTKLPEIGLTSSDSEDDHSSSIEISNSSDVDNEEKDNNENETEMKVKEPENDNININEKTVKRVQFEEESEKTLDDSSVNESARNDTEIRVHNYRSRPRNVARRLSKFKKTIPLASMINPSSAPHVYSKWEKKEMKNYGSIVYRNPRSEIYQEFIRTSEVGTATLWRWCLFIVISIIMSVTAFTLKIVSEKIIYAKLEFLYELFGENKLIEAYVWYLGLSLVLILVGSSLVIWFEPRAAGSGIPEVIGYLNGVRVSGIFTPKVYIAKVISVICAVSSGLPLGPEGPMIHIGGTIGASVAYSNPILGKIIPWYQNKNQEDKRNFVLGGVAAGVAAAFNAPIGGLAFAWEEISTFWDGKTGWMILFGCMLSAFGTNLLLSATLSPENVVFTRGTILFFIPAVDELGVWIFLPAIVIGLIGGILGVIFTWIALGIGKLKKKYLQNNVLKLLEPIVIVLLFMTIGFFFSLRVSM
jgi:chloride channel 7